MQCQDIDLSKSGEFSQLSEDLSEIKFTINKIHITNSHALKIISDIEQSSSKNPLSATAELKLKFYSALSRCKLKQKITRVSIQKSFSTSTYSCILTLPKDQISLKVSFPTHQEYEIFGKVFIHNLPKYSGLKQNQQPSNLLGTFQINLMDWKRQMIDQKVRTQNNNLENANSLKKVWFKVSKIQKVKAEKKLSEELSVDINQKQEFQQDTVQRSQRDLSYKSSAPLQNFIEFKILQEENVENVFNNFPIQQIENLGSKQKRLQIVNSIVDEKIPECSEFPNFSTRRSKNFFLPEKQVLRKLNRVRSESFLQASSLSKLSEKIFRPIAQEPIKRESKTFKEQIYELLQEVKYFKKDFKIQRQRLEQKAPLSKIKNLYFLISSKREDSSLLKSVVQKIQNHKKNPENDELLMPISSVLKSYNSQAKFSICENEQEPSLSLNAKYQKVLRIEKRLQSFEKVKKLSNLNLSKVQEIGEASQKQIKAEC